VEDSRHESLPPNYFGYRKVRRVPHIYSRDDRKLLVDCVCGQTTGFEVHAVADDNNAIKGEASFGTVPGDELVDGVLVDPA
jgi:hypothetical protein